MKREIRVKGPLNLHTHIRVSPVTQATLAVKKGFEYELIMPNLDPPVVTAGDMVKYRDMILALKPDFIPMMTVKLVQRREGHAIATTPDILRDAQLAGAVGAKAYPEKLDAASDQQTTMNAMFGVYDYFHFVEELGAMEELDIPLLIHPEDAYANPAEAEAAFIPILNWIRKNFPRLRIVIEHVSSRAMVEWVVAQNDPEHVIATITAHHLDLTTEDVRDAAGHICHPDNYCKPEAKTADDRRAVRWAALSGHPSFVFGADDAPHLSKYKGPVKLLPGCYTAVGLLERVVEFFAHYNRLEVLPGFISGNGSRFHRLTPTREIVLVPDRWVIPDRVEVPEEDDYIVPQNAGQVMQLKIQQA